MKDAADPNTLNNEINQIKSQVSDQIAQAKAELNEQLQNASDCATSISSTFQNVTDVINQKGTEASNAIRSVATAATDALNSATQTLNTAWT